MTEKTLDVADVDAFFEEIGGDRMAEHVWGDAVADGAAFAVKTDEAADHLWRGGVAAGVDQERPGGRGATVAGGAVVAQQGFQLVGHEDSSLAVAFADDGDGAVLHVDGRVEQARELGDAHAGGEEQLGGDVGGEICEGVGRSWRRRRRRSDLVMTRGRRFGMRMRMRAPRNGSSMPWPSSSSQWKNDRSVARWRLTEDSLSARTSKR